MYSSTTVRLFAVASMESTLGRLGQSVSIRAQYMLSSDR